MKKAVLSLSIFAALAAGNAMAQDSSFYVGARAGAHLFENACEVESCDNTNAGFGAIVGYDFGNPFAIEATYDYLGDTSVNSKTFKPATGPLSMVTLAPKFSYGLTDATDLYGKVGASWWMFDTDVGGEGKIDDVAYLGAVGLDHRVNDLLNLRLEYQYTGGIDKEFGTNYKFKGDSHFVTAGFTVHFGRSAAAMAPVAAAALPEDNFQPEPVINEILVPELFSSVQFGFDRSELTTEAISLLQPTLQRLQDIPESTAVVSGYTDSIGSEEFNETLSKRRAQTVAQYFSTNGIDSNRMIVQGLGESSPVATNSTAAGRQMNRRVEVYSPELVVVEEN